MQRRRPFVWFCVAGYFLLAFGDTMRAGWSASGNTWINGGSMITTRAIIYSVLGVIAAAGIVAEPMSRDRSCRTQGQLLATGAGRLAVGLGRFLVAFAIVLLSASMFIPGTILGSMMPGIAPEQVGPMVWSHYGGAMVCFILPNMLLTSAVVFCVAARWQSQAIAYGAAVGGVALWVTTRSLLGRDVLRHEVFTQYALLDPYGTIAQLEYTIAWTVAQLNDSFPPLRGLLLANRLIWGGLSLALVAVGIAVMPTRESLPKAVGQRRRGPSLTRRISQIIPALPGQLTMMTGWELRVLWRHPGAKVCLGFAAFSLWWSAAGVVTQLFSLPTTDLLVHNTGYYFDKVLVLVIVWVAADLLWRERSLGVSEVIDAQPTSDTSRYLAKTLALMVVVLVFWALSILVNVTYQAAHGFTEFEIALHLTDTFAVKAPYYLWLAVLSVAIQAVVRQRFVAIGVVLLVYLYEILFDALHWYHPLFRYGRVSFFWYSLMDGYGHFWQAHLWFVLYWTLGAAIVGVVGWGVHGRGPLPAPRSGLVRQRLLRGRGAATLGSLLVLFVAVGSFIWVQSTVRATWPPINEDRVKAAIELEYGPTWRGIPQPRVVAIAGNLDLFPSERRFELHGTFTLENQSHEPIQELLILTEPWLRLDRVDLGTGAVCLDRDEQHYAEHWRLAEPLPPGQRMTMRYVTSSKPPAGFAVHAQNDDAPTVTPVEVLGNGTSLLNLQIMPAVGYTDRVEHKPAWKRRRLGLPEAWAAPAGPDAERQAHATLHLGWVESVDMTITTDADQTVVHGGQLLESHQQPDGRMAFHYRIDRPNRGWTGILSGRYAQTRHTRAGLPDVVMYHDPRHTYVVEPWAEAFHDAMAHFADRYGPPPFETFRMAEQSLHYDGMGARGGMAYATEVLGWKTDLRLTDGENLHELAGLMMSLCWFGDQLIPANVAGAKVIHSGLPHWAAALYLHQRRDPETDRQLRLQVLREVFRGRGAMVDEESPFVEEFKDSNMIRKKGSVQILHLAHLVGTKNLEAIFAEFLAKHRYQPAPYPTAEDFMEHLRARIDPQYHPQLVDLFERVTTWRLSVRNPTVTPTDDGRYRLTATVEARKFYTTGWGEQTEAELNTPIPLVAFKGRGFRQDEVLISEDRLLPSGTSEIIMLLDEPPTRFGIDPYIILPDPNPYDNVRGIRATP